jgi:uncharacterized phiE125 gp8 family phage protein
MSLIYYSPPSWYYAWSSTRYARTGVKVLNADQIVEPINIAEAALHLRIDAIDSPPEYPDQELIEWQISAAREYCEQYMGRSIAQKTLEYRTDQFPAACYDQDGIPLPMGPVLRVIQVSYIAEDGTETIMDDGTGSPTNIQFELDTWTEPARLRAPYNVAWPSGARYHAGSVRVQYIAGYGLPSDSPTEAEILPYSVKAAMLLVLGHLYESRENTVEQPLTEIPLGAKALLEPYRLHLGFA